MVPTLDLLPNSTPLANQVAGHQNVLSDASGSLVIKPALPREIAFYQLINSSPRSSTIARLKPFLASFYGTLRLEGRLEAGTVKRDMFESAEVPESVVLENLAHAYTYPSILDVKLGTVMYAPDASPEKRAKMETRAAEGTSLETGMRLTGCQTWHAPSHAYILTPKSYGKSLLPSQLSQGMTRFFPMPTDIIPALIIPPIPPSSGAVLPLSSTSTPSHLPLPPSLSLDLPPSPASTSSNRTYTDHALPGHLLLRVLDILDHELDSLIKIIDTIEMRFIGSSVLVVYEGDVTHLTSALSYHDSSRENGKRSSGLSDDESDELDLDDSSATSDDDMDDRSRKDSPKSRRCPPVSLRMIDFAHTRLVEGEGPDQGVLKGLRSLSELVKRRRADVIANTAEAMHGL